MLIMLHSRQISNLWLEKMQRRKAVAKNVLCADPTWPPWLCCRLCAERGRSLLTVWSRGTWLFLELILTFEPCVEEVCLKAAPSWLTPTGSSAEESSQRASECFSCIKSFGNICAALNNKNEQSRRPQPFSSTAWAFVKVTAAHVHLLFPSNQEHRLQNPAEHQLHMDGMVLI